MGSQVSASILEDFLESIEHLPVELREKFSMMTQKEATFDELKRSLHKQRHVLMKVQTKGEMPTKTPSKEVSTGGAPEAQSPQQFDAFRLSCLQRIEKDYQHAMCQIEDKITIGQEIKTTVCSFIMCWFGCMSSWEICV